MADTKGASEHVAYEIGMFYATHGLLMGDAIVGRLHNAVLESFAIHVRNLVEFLFDPPEKDDIRAEHYFKDPKTWHGLRGKKPEELTAAQKQANKQISHLTYARVGADKGWFVGDLSFTLHGPLRLFLDKAEEDLMGEPLRELKKQVRP
jgi:hypothetical protein